MNQSGKQILYQAFEPSSRLHGRFSWLKQFAAVFVLMSVLIYSNSLTNIAYANAIDDIETSNGNALGGGLLDFSLQAGSYEPVGKDLNLLPGETVSRSVKVVNEGNLNFQYDVKSVKFDGDIVLCGQLLLSASVGGIAVYDGQLLLFDSGDVIFSAAASEWTFSITLPAHSPPSVQGESCWFGFLYDARQENSPVGSGFADSEIVDNMITAGTIQNPVVIPAVEDARVFEAQSGQNFGKEEELHVTSGLGSNERSFVKFNVNLPEKSLVSSARLLLFNFAPAIAPRNYQVRKALSDWKEYGITWGNQPPVGPRIFGARSAGGFMSWDVADDLQEMIDSGTNYGWRVNDSREDDPRALLVESKFHSREFATENLRPMLEVFVTAPPAKTDHVVVNEVYPLVNRNRGTDPQNEWVELYNPTASPVNMSNWQICDSSECDSFPGGKVFIPAFGYAVVTSDNSSTWPNWPELSPDAVLIQLNSFIGGGLSNTGDSVVIKDENGVVVDGMSYGSDTSQLNPSVPFPVFKPFGSLVRIIKGYDTDTAKDWVTNITPNPGLSPSTSGSELMRFTEDGVAAADPAVGWQSLLDRVDGANEVDEESVIAGESSFKAAQNSTATTETSGPLTTESVETAEASSPDTTEEVLTESVIEDAGGVADAESNDAADSNASSESSGADDLESGSDVSQQANSETQGEAADQPPVEEAQNSDNKDSAIQTVQDDGAAATGQAPDTNPPPAPEPAKEPAVLPATLPEDPAPAIDPPSGGGL